MDVREKLVELCEDLETLPCCDTYEGQADYLVAHGVTVQEWISVKDRLPEHKGNYLGFTGSTTMVGYYKGNGVWWVWLNDREGENLFTHWMPLPPVPEEEKNDR